MTPSALRQDATDFSQAGLDQKKQEVRVVLVVDDSRAQRKTLTAMLESWGFDVLQAASGEQALEICSVRHVDFVLSDWMMPGMNGLEFCQKFRTLNRRQYGYFILLTSKSEKGEIARGLEVGADDFLTKPVNADELRARITAGERILKVQNELQEKNRMASTTLGELTKLYDIIDRDLIEAKKLQQSLIRERTHEFHRARLSLLLRSSGHVGGDLVGFFSANERQLGFWGIDVSGHGITSALMTARLSGNLSGCTPEQNIALEVDKGVEFRLRDPAETARRLNAIVINELDTEHYFTLLLGHLDFETGEVVMCQAGHPHPIIQRASGNCETVGSGGMPIGLFETANYENFRIQLLPGDRLIIPSDGITECPGDTSPQFDDEGLCRFLECHRQLRGESLLEALVWRLTEFSGSNDFPDDVSAVLLEYGPP